MRQLILELGPRQTPSFESYVPGRSIAAVQALRRSLAGGERFVYLWGPGGSGKTHLLQSFVEAARATRRSAYLDAARPDWSAAADAEAVAIDDAGRLNPVAQVALFDLYNRLHASGGSIAASGDAAPAALGLRADLRSRLASGIVLQLHPLNDAEKSEALREHAKRRGISLGEDLLGYLLSHLERDMGTQIAVLDALDRYSLEHQRPITLPLLKQALASLREREGGR